MLTIDEKVEAQECRIRKLEQDNAATGVKMDNLISTMNSLLGWVKTLVIALIPAVGYLVLQFLKK